MWTGFICLRIRNQQRNKLSSSTRHLTSCETVSLSRAAPCGVSIFRKMKARLSNIQQWGAYYTKTYGEWSYNTMHSYPRPGIEETGLALWPDRLLLNRMGGHQSRSAVGICRQPNGLSLLAELFWYLRRMLLPGWRCASRGRAAQG